MASVNDAPERLRSLARKIDPEILQHLGVCELRVRLESAADLYEDMARTDDEHKRNRLRKEADATLSAISLKAWIATANLLADAAADAARRGDDKAAQGFRDDLHKWTRRQPQPCLGDRAVQEEISGVKQAAAKSPRWFQFWRKK